MRVDPLGDDVRIGGRTLVLAETLDLTLESRRLRLPDGGVLLLSSTHTAEEAQPPPPAHSLSSSRSPTDDTEVPPGFTLEPAPELELNLRLAPATPSPSLAGRIRIPRPKLRLPRISLPFRVSRAVSVSVGVHAVLALLLFLLLALIPTTAPDRERVLHFRLSGIDVSAKPEARQGAGNPDDPQSGDNAAADARSADRADEDLAAALDAEAGAAADPTTTGDAVGAGRAPAGALLSSRRGGRERLLAAGGGNAAADGALTAALTWLARHQASDGSWDGETFSELCNSGDACGGPAEHPYRDAATALALMPFLGAGHTHREGPWRETIRDGLAALIRAQHDDGSFGIGKKRVYAGAIATLVLAEAYGMTGSEVLREPARRAAEYFVKRQSEQGGWRYHPGNGAADTSVTGWVAMALVAARKAHLGVPARALGGARSWLRGRTAPSGLVGYTGQGRGTDALLGVGLFCRVLLGTKPTDEALQPIVTKLMVRLPEWPSDPAPRGYGNGDAMHWYYGSLGAFQAGGATWRLWEPRLRDLLLTNQRNDGCAAGSFDAVGTTGLHGGRVVLTALCALSLEVTYRYPRATFGR